MSNDFVVQNFIRSTKQIYIGIHEGKEVYCAIGDNRIMTIEVENNVARYYPGLKGIVKDLVEAPVKKWEDAMYA